MAPSWRRRLTRRGNAVDHDAPLNGTDMDQTMKEQQQSETESSTAGDDCKVFVSRIPTRWDEASFQRVLEERLGGGEGSVVNVALIYPQDSADEEDAKRTDDEENEMQQDHRGFAFVTLDSHERQLEALALGTVRGGRTSSSTKKHTLYLRPIVRNDEDNDTAPQQATNICFLWTNKRCPYGDDCKFLHQGQGACLPIKSGDGPKKKKKCFAYKKGKCTKGENCPFSHDFEVTAKEFQPRADSEKDCISWKTKGKCNKKDACPYRHDEALRTKAVEKKKRKHQSAVDISRPKERQPLSIRVFGLNYDTTEADVRSFFQHCGPIRELTFPTFEDSGRSKGYCGILFQSPKAVAKAVDELDGQELHGRWLRVQAGKMYLRQWEEQHESRRVDLSATGNNDQSLSPQVGEFGQKVKKRKKHGFKDSVALAS